MISFTAVFIVVDYDTVLGEGAYGRVHPAASVSAGERVALKRLSKRHTDSTSFFGSETNALLRIYDNGMPDLRNASLLAIPSFPSFFFDLPFHIDELLNLLPLLHAIVQTFAPLVAVAHPALERPEAELGLDLPVDAVLRRVPFRGGEAYLFQRGRGGSGMGRACVRILVPVMTEAKRAK